MWNSCTSVFSNTRAWEHQAWDKQVHIYRGRLNVMDVPRLQTESGQIAPTSPSSPSHSSWSSAPWGLLRYPKEPSNVLPLMGSGPARPDRPRQNNNNNKIKKQTKKCCILKQLLQRLRFIMSKSMCRLPSYIANALHWYGHTHTRITR